MAAKAYARASSRPGSPTSPPRSRKAATASQRVEDAQVVQGRILWLPPREDVPDRAVKRAHGKGAIDEGIYNHPVVVTSRPVDEPHVVHVHLVSASLLSSSSPPFDALLLMLTQPPQVTSFQGKRLDEIYNKANEFHQSRRSWYLPISPTPPHPDAQSKKAKRRFPNLDLAADAALRWDSYVNLRDVYRVEWRHLRPYSNPSTPGIDDFRLERESMVRLLAKGRVLTAYAPGPQHQLAAPVSLPGETSTARSGIAVSELDSQTWSVESSRNSSPGPSQPDFSLPRPERPGYTGRPPRAPPEVLTWYRVVVGGIIRYILTYILRWPLHAVRFLWALRLRRDTQ